MKLFFKHIRRSILCNPQRPLLLALIATLAVAIAITAVGLTVMLYDHTQQSILVTQELGDICITPRADSGTRFLWSDDAEMLIGEDGTVLGEFRLSGLVTHEDKEHLLAISALDLYQADRYFEFHYLAMGEFTTENLSQAAILSKTTATTYGLAVGDTLTVRLLQREFIYTVEAIAEDGGLLREVEMLISLPGVLMALAEQVPVIGTFGDSHLPYTRLLIKADPDVDSADILHRLTASSLCASMLIQQTSSAAEMDFWLLMELIGIWVVTLLLLMLCAMLITGTLHMIHRRRAREYALFLSVGATKRQIHTAIYAESGIYALVSMLGGLLLSVPLLYGTICIYGYEVSPFHIALTGLLTGVCFPLILMYLCTVLHLRRTDTVAIGRGETTISLPQKSARTRRTLLPPLVLTLLCLLLGLFLPVTLRIIPMVGLLFSLTWFAFVLTPLCLKHAALWLETHLERRDTRAGGWLLATKNLHRHTGIRHVGRMLTVLCMLVTTIACCRHGLVQYFDILTKDIPFDMMTSQMSDALQESFSHDQDVEGTLQVTYVSGVALPNGGNATAISLLGDTMLWLDETLLPQNYPKGRELAISRGLATLAGVKTGDSLTLMLDGVTHEFTVSEIMNIQPNFLYFDAAALGIRHDIFCIAVKNEDAATIQRLGNMAEMGGSAVLPLSALLGTGPQTATSHLTLLRYALWAAVLLSLLGCLQIVAEHLQERHDEAQILRLCGMTKSRLYLLYAREMLLTLIGAGLLAAVGAVLLCLAVHFGVNSFGMVLFI